MQRGNYLPTGNITSMQQNNDMETTELAERIAAGATQLTNEKSCHFGKAEVQ
jgi:hypothetical protein